MAHDVFLSYSVKDKVVADAVVARLEAESVTCWVAPRDVVPGADWGESIINAIESSRIMILIFSKSANESRQIKREVERAVNKEVYIIPFRVDDIAPAKNLEYFISTSQWMDAFAPPLERHLGNLAKTIKAVLASPSLPKPVDIKAPVNPPLLEPVDIDAAVTPVGRTGPVADGSTARPFSRSRMAIIAAISALLVLVAAGWYLGHKREVPPRPARQMVRPGERTQPQVAKIQTLNIASVTRERPYENSLGMKFVPVPGTKVLFSIWDTRVQDYEGFVRQTHRTWPKASFEQTPMHPAVNVSWEDGKAFCAWLTETERKAGRISDKQEYRLPTDPEWSVAVGKSKYPWGDKWPPPSGAGNYSPSLHTDDYKFTSPVGAFAPNAAGLYDMGGNVWQWCEGWYRKEMNEKEVLDKQPDLKDDSGGKKMRIVRGASFYVGAETYLLSSIRVAGGSSSGRNSNNGFRCVLGESDRSVAEGL